MTVRPLRTPEGGPTPLRVISGGGRPRRRAFLWALYTLGAVASFLALIYLRTAVDEAAYEVRRLENQIRFEEARQHQLHLEKIRLESPGEIVPIAEHLLGMVLPDDVVPVAVFGVHTDSPGPAGPGGDAGSDGDAGPEGNVDTVRRGAQGSEPGDSPVDASTSP